MTGDAAESSKQEQAIFNDLEITISYNCKNKSFVKVVYGWQGSIPVSTIAIIPKEQAVSKL